MTPNLLEQRFIAGVVGNLRLFAEAPPSQVAALARQSWVVSARRGDLLARRAERLPGLFIVAYGLAKLAMRGRESGERVLRLVGAGQTFGAATALLGRASRYDALALADTKAVVIPSPSLVALMDTDPRFGRTLAFLLAERNLELQGEVEAATLKRGAQRLACYLGSLAAGAGRAELPVSKTLVAAQLGMKKETLSRLLRQLGAERVIEVMRREIVILDAAALDRIASAATGAPA
jgi:CRP/FNR family transcriptional regulator, dissimilatory nitrate respiration regulator